MTTSDLKEYIDRTCQQVDQALDRFLPPETTSPEIIHKAMRYSIFAGGKRLRPVLCLAAAEACGGSAEDALPAACAIEMMHTYSLIHDDLPGMDNDDLRRGKPTSHKVFGVGMAILAGDALLTESFAVLAATKPTALYPVREFLAEHACTGGSRKLIGGQVLDLEGEHKPLSEQELINIHMGKTAALLTTALRFGAMTANAPAPVLQGITDFGLNLGLAFQVIDDILDVTVSTEQLGKTAGKDVAAQKATYPSILGLDRAREEARRLTEAALAALDILPEENRGRLIQIARYLLDRTY